MCGMKKYISAYQMFLPYNTWWVKFLIYVVSPLIFVGMGYAISFAPVLLGCIMLFAENLLQYFTFGGIVQKDSASMDYIFSSERGITLVRKGVETDSVRRLILLLLCISAGQMKELRHSGVAYLFFVYGVMEISALILKCLDGFMVCYVTTLIGMVVLITVWMPVEESVWQRIWMMPLCGFIAVLMLGVHQRITMERIRRKRYGGRDKKDVETNEIWLLCKNETAGNRNDAGRGDYDIIRRRDS